MCARCVVPRKVVPPVPPSSACVAAAAATFVHPRASRPRHAGAAAFSLKSPHSTVNEASSLRACRSAAAARRRLGLPRGGVGKGQVARRDDDRPVAAFAGRDEA